MANWQDDPDLAALRPRGGSTPWGRIFLGVMLVSCGTFGLAYYLPLYRAHLALVDDHATLRSEVDSIKQKLTQTESELKSTTEKRDELETEVKASQAKASSQASDVSSQKSALESAVEKLAKKKLAVVGGDATGARVAFVPGALFTPGKLEPSASGAAALCAVAKAAGTKSLHVIGVATDDEVPSALKSQYPNAWEYASAAAGAVASALHDKCSVAGAKLYSEASDGSRPASPAFASDKPPAPRVEIVLTSEPKS